MIREIVAGLAIAAASYAGTPAGIWKIEKHAKKDGIECTINYKKDGKINSEPAHYLETEGYTAKISRHVLIIRKEGRNFYDIGRDGLDRAVLMDSTTQEHFIDMECLEKEESEIAEDMKQNGRDGAYGRRRVYIVDKDKTRCYNFQKKEREWMGKERIANLQKMYLQDIEDFAKILQ